MIQCIPYPSPDAEKRLEQIADRRSGADPAVEAVVREALTNVKRDGDSALVSYTRRFDSASFTAELLRVVPEEIEKAYADIDSTFLDDLRGAVENIENFHRKQLRSSYFTTSADGTVLGQMILPVASAGMYIPGGKGGRTPLISSVLMNAIPARLAGVADIAMVTPPREDGTVDPHLLVAAAEVGVHRVHRVGSCWAIAALAFGTPCIPKVDVIVGPGNIYVTTAKRLVSGEVGIDLLAGPSEILIVADEGANPDYIAADLLSQAEHDPMASAILVTTDAGVAGRCAERLNRRISKLSREEIAAESLTRYGAAFVTADLETALELANRIAPEHLELQVRDPWACLGKIQHAGAVFLGDSSPEAVGDYFAGTNHVLPTAGTARFASALGVDSFIKRTSVIAYSRAALERDGNSIVRLARLEGLEAHAASVLARTGKD